MVEEKEGYFENTNLYFMPDFSGTVYTGLNLNHNHLHSLCEDFIPRTCKVVLAGHNNLTADGLPTEWPEQVETISLDANSIRDTEETSWPVGLTALNLDGNPLQVWPNRLPDSLTSLNVSHTNIQKVDPLPRQLKRLEANSSKVKQLPTSLPDSLEFLFLYNNLLRNSRLPFAWGENLKILDLTRNALTKFPEHLPDSLETLYLDENKITEIPARLPTNLVTLVLESNLVRKITLEPRRKPLQVFSVANNQLTVSVRQLQREKGIDFALTIREIDNWYDPVFDESVKKIQKAWKVYRMKKPLKAFLKTSRVKGELQQVSMHPCRAGRFENISSEWGWGC